MRSRPAPGGAGGSAWESNPPSTPKPAPNNGFEDRGRHQPPSASAADSSQLSRIGLSACQIATAASEHRKQGWPKLSTEAHGPREAAMNPAQGKPRTQSANIFINYRREDSAGHAGRLFDALNDHFEGRLFMDVDNLDPGTDFIVAIEEAVGSCEALTVVIGQEWLTATDKTGRRRLDDPGDFVRLELESALARK